MHASFLQTAMAAGDQKKGVYMRCTTSSQRTTPLSVILQTRTYIYCIFLLICALRMSKPQSASSDHFTQIQSQKRNCKQVYTFHQCIFARICSRPSVFSSCNFFLALDYLRLSYIYGRALLYIEKIVVSCMRG